MSRTGPQNPDCLDGKHIACSGTAWNDDTDDICRCGCPCHRGAR